ncbi:MAG: hypothetical protein AB9M53_01490 [Leptothrix sp. (in: b-proteobacteria)]
MSTRPDPVRLMTRRSTLSQLLGWGGVATAGWLTAGCGGGSAPAAGAVPTGAAALLPTASVPTSSEPPAPAPVAAPPVASSPAAATPLARIQAALVRRALSVSATPVSVSQGLNNDITSSFGPSAQVFPPLLGNTSRVSLADIPQLWGHRRDRWTRQSGASLGPDHPLVPVSLTHPDGPTSSSGLCGLHFVFDGAAFEVWFAGSNVTVTLIADGQYMSPAVIEQRRTNTYTRFDFGSAATRQVSFYGTSSQGPCAIAIAAGDHLQPWDRSADAAFAAMTDSYGGAPSPMWGLSGPFWEAAAWLGCAHFDMDAVGGTGYTRALSNDPTAASVFAARLPGLVDAMPDLVLSAGSLNDNDSLVLTPYASAAAARMAHVAAVEAYFSDLRAALPAAVLVANGPWRPGVPTAGTDPATKAATIESALRRVGGPWVYLDNLNGGWRNSSGANAAPSTPWQSGLGSADPLLSDGTHPTAIGSGLLAQRLATDLRAALLAL